MQVLHNLGNRIRENYRQLHMAALELELAATASPTVRKRQREASKAFAFHAVTSPELAGGFLVMMIAMIILRPFGTGDDWVTLIFWIIGFLVHYWFIYISQGWLLYHVFFRFGLLSFDFASIALYTTTSVSAIVLGHLVHPTPSDINIVAAILGMGGVISAIVLFSTAFRIMQGHPFYHQPRGKEKLMKLIPADKKGDISYFSANDHYLDVTTSNGTSLIRVSFADAVEMMLPSDGIQIHRSHWVARDSIESIERRTGGKQVLRLSDGNELPVARGRLKDVRAFVEEVNNEKARVQQ